MSREYCSKCNKELKVFSEIFKCHRCNNIFCSKHRLPEEHDCPVSFKKDIFKEKEVEEIEPNSCKPDLWDRIRVLFHKLKIAVKKLFQSPY